MSITSRYVSKQLNNHIETQAIKGKTVTQWHMLALMGLGYLLPLMGAVGKVFGYGFLIIIGLLFLDILLKGQQSSDRFFFLMGLIIGGEAFFRDFVMRGFVGYMVVEYLLIALGVLSLNPIIKNSSRIPKSIIPWGIFCLWAGLSMLISLDPLRGRWFLLIFLSGFFTILLCSAFNNSQNKLNYMYGIVSGVCLAFGTAFYNEIHNPRSIQRFGHSFLSAVQVGIFLTVGLLVILFIVMFYKKRISSFIFPVIALSVGALLTFSRGPVFGLALTLPFLFLSKSNTGEKIKLIFFLIILIGALYIFVSTNYQESFADRYQGVEVDTGRINAWNRSIVLWKEKPLTGWGIGSWAIIYPRTFRAVISDAHNFFFQILVETGLIGAILTIIFLLSTAVHILKRKRFADLGLLAYIIAVGLVENWKIAIFFGLFGMIFMQGPEEKTEGLETKQVMYASDRI